MRRAAPYIVGELLQIVIHYDPDAAMRIVDEIRVEDWPGVARGFDGQLASDLVRTLISGGPDAKHVSGSIDNAVNTSNPSAFSRKADGRSSYQHSNSRRFAGRTQRSSRE